ncbi:MAG: imidazole glycerol phosphate synthase subunit HisH [Alphaproteobacteria bacterium]
MHVGIIDYGMGNLASVASALERIGVDSNIVSSASEIDALSHIILPGVGSFKKAMSNLTEGQWVSPIRTAAKSGKSILGICLGMHLLADHGTEHGSTEGIGLISGQINRFEERNDKDFLIPHVGWNEIHITKTEHPIFEKVKDRSDFYFVHSYVFCPQDKSDIAAITPYGENFPSIVIKDNVIGMQFHPEKSGPVGEQVLKNFIGMS